MEKISDIEKRQLEKEVDNYVDSIDYNLATFDVIVDSVIGDKELSKVLLYLSKVIFDYINSNDRVEIRSDIFCIDRIINDAYTNFSSMLASDTYSNIDSGMDKMDTKYFLDLIYDSLYQVRAIIRKSDIKNNDIVRDNVRITYLKKELNNLVMKMKMMGFLAYDVPMDKINELILYVSNNYYLLHFSIIESLFIDSVRNIDNLSYEKYDIEMQKLSLYSSVNNIENNMYAFLDEDGQAKLKEIKNIIKNISDMDRLDNIEIILEYLKGIQFIRYEYPSENIWKKMILELLSMVIGLINRISKDNNREELIKLKEAYLNLKKKYYEMIFIGKGQELIDIEKTERENLMLVKKLYL